MTLASEQNVLGAVLLSPASYWTVADLLSADHFSTQGHRAIWKAFGKLNDAERPIDPFTVAEATNWDDRDPYLIQLASQTPSAANIRAYAESVRNTATSQRVRLVGERIAANGDLGEAQTAIAEITDDQPGRLVTSSDAAKSMWAGVMERWESKEASGLLTGIPKLDAMTGGLQKGRVYAIGARAKMGKSMLAWQIAAHAAVHLGKRVVGFSLEMSNDELMQRMACSLSGVRSYGLLNPKSMNNEEWAKLNIAMKQLRDAPLFLSDRMDMSIEQINAHARQAKPDLVVVDYLQLIEPPKMANRTDQLEYITRRLKKMAKDGAPVIEVFQVNRGNETSQNPGPPMPSNARGSGTIEQDCDAMLLLHRPSYYDKQHARKGLRLELALQRNGPTGVIRMEDDLECCRFLPSDEDWTDEKAKSTGADL